VYQAGDILFFADLISEVMICWGMEDAGEYPVRSGYLL